DAVQLAGVLVSGDPLARFMHDEMRLEDSVAQIQRMANAAPMTAEKMFKLLREKWEAELASYTLETVTKRHMASREAYNTREATGEMSTEYMQRLFPGIKNDEAPPDASTDAKGKKHLEFGGDAKAKLSQLESAVSVVSIAPAPQGGVVDGVNLTGKQ